ncbi:chorismate-binding protein [Fulvivirgaceae bacterium BMA10]|uniref:Chorismate-binding protein n=1 Tax=Splendidivirga corallicola TaxID=3051826 RepID=A0ABT8KR47_9BACT|nr:chorismate-binding protein [Fulvivirgaceae bacterium BMA10]
MEHLQEWRTFQENLIGASERYIFKTLFNFSVEHDWAIALWRLPHQTEKHLIIDSSQTTKVVKADLEELPEGFIIAPFDGSGANQTIFINNDLYFSSKEKKLSISPALKWDESKIQLEGLFEKFSNGMVKNKGTSFYTASSDETQSTSKDQYIEMVRKAVGEIAENKFEKVVPSKIKLVPLDQNFEIIEIFEKLCEAYPNAFISIVSHPEIGTWVGATPEKLISIDKNKMFQTISLAGTQKIDKDTDLREVAWKQKEIEEQAMVSRYIINCFKKIRLREFTEKGPRTARAGALAHLQTEFNVDTEATNFTQLGTVMLDLLHPTSAVCGMPKEPANAFLLKNEVHQRAYFSGYLGPVNVLEESRIFVNIRCMQLLSDSAVLYSGAGVTENSDPEHEWEETEIKCETILRILKE